MAGFVETVSTLNSAIRTLLVLLAIGAASIGAYLGYTTYYQVELDAQKKSKQLAEAAQTLAEREHEIARQQELIQRRTEELAEKQIELERKDEQIGALEVDVALKQERINQLDTALRLIKVDHRLARITVLDQGTDEQGDVYTQIEFVELNESGEPIDEPRPFRLKGEMIYVEYLVAKFEDKYVEQADLDRATSICLFRRIFSEQQEPKDGFLLDQPNTRPTAYARGSQMSQFEKKIWDDFWNIANDPERARELGIRAAHAEAPAIKAMKGKVYQLELRSSGGLTITPVSSQ